MPRPPSLAASVAALVLLGLTPTAGAVDWVRMQQAAERLGPRAVAALQALQPLLRRWATLPPEAQLQAVNDWVNQRLSFATDWEHWGREDYWASPLESLGARRGDCEDYAIAKYALLRALGIEPRQLRLVYATLRRDPDLAPEPHVLLLFQADLEAEPLLLDNLVLAVHAASTRRDLTPRFSFNHRGLWRGDGAADGDPLQRLPLWRGVVAKLHEQGFD